MQVRASLTVFYRLWRNSRAKVLIQGGSQAEACATILPNPASSDLRAGNRLAAEILTEYVRGLGIATGS